MRLSAEDRLALRDLMARYEHLYCVQGHEDSFFEVFTDDAILDGPRGYHQGVEGIRAFGRQQHPPGVVDRPRVRTRLSNFLVEGSGDEATIRAAFVRIKDPDPVTGRRDLVTGSYECMARRVDGTWKLSHRICRVDGVPQFRETAEYAAGRRYVLVWGDHGSEYRLEDEDPASAP